MKYAFADFVFDTENLTLYKDKDVVACRHNEAKLLALFLSQPERIFSKDEILEQVWSDKVVSEQAVFQNISVLRSLFGDHAIKTFSKKGYQWQLDVKPFVEPEVTPTKIQLTATTNSKHRESIWIASALISVLLIAGTFFYWRSNQVDSQLIHIAVLPPIVEKNNQDDQKLNAELVQSVWQSLNQTHTFHPTPVSDLKDYDDFFYAPQKYFTQLATQTRSNVIMASKVGMHRGKFRINYVLKSEKGVWGAEHEAETISLLLEKMNTQIALVLQSQILDVDIWDSALRNAKLKILHQQAPDDVDVGSQLARSEVRNGNADNAILLADDLVKSAQQHGNKIGEGSGYLIMAEALIAQGLFERAETELQKASAIFQEQQDYSLLVFVQYNRANLTFSKNDYHALKKPLTLAIEFARLAKDPQLEVSANIFLSVMANKYGQKDDRQFYLDQAELLLDQTHQSREHYAAIYFYSGMYADTEILAEKNYRKALSVLPNPQDWWEGERAQAHLVELLIKQSRWKEALDLFAGRNSLSASEESTVASIYSAQQQWGQAETHYLNSFKLANLGGQANFALDAALALVDLQHKAGTPEKAQAHLQFIHREANKSLHWARLNKFTLDRLGISLPEQQ